MSRAHCGPLQKARWKAYYGAQPARTLTNAKRRLARHMRLNPKALDAMQLYSKRYGADSLVSITANRPSKARPRQ